MVWRLDKDLNSNAFPYRDMKTVSQKLKPYSVAVMVYDLLLNDLYFCLNHQIEFYRDLKEISQIFIVNICITDNSIIHIKIDNVRRELILHIIIKLIINQFSNFCLNNFQQLYIKNFPFLESKHITIRSTF